MAAFLSANRKAWTEEFDSANASLTKGKEDPAIFEGIKKKVHDAANNNDFKECAEILADISEHYLFQLLYKDPEAEQHKLEYSDFLISLPKTKADQVIELLKFELHQRDDI